MSTYVIGDVQGCYRTLQKLLRTIDVREGVDRVVLLGDLVGRGPDALGVLRFVSGTPHIHAVLGNHDLALIACAQGLLRPHASDLLDAVLVAPDAATLIATLRTTPFVQFEEGHLLVHAGIMPSWSIAEVKERAQAAHMAIASPESAAAHLARFFRLPASPQASAAAQRIDESIEVMTCLRTLDAHGSPYAAFKGELASMPSGITPWFRAPSPMWHGTPICCGHWSALGVHQEHNVTLLDGGCVWGRKLCAMRLGDGAMFEVQHAEDDTFSS